MTNERLPAPLRREVERAIAAATHPHGRSTHDGMARVSAATLQRMLALIDGPAAEPKAPLPDPVDAMSGATVYGSLTARDSNDTTRKLWTMTGYWRRAVNRGDERA